MNDKEQELRAHLNAETGKIEWAELERHFARGSVVKVNATLDLVEVATCFVRDDSDKIRTWLATNELARATDEDAHVWGARQSQFWAVVAAPWVLVQEIEHSDS